MKKIVSLVGAALVLAAIPMSADATPTVTVHLDVELADTAGFTLPTGDCDTVVPSGSNGLAVLDAAVEQGCIESYDTNDFGWGEYVTCINRLCEQFLGLGGTFWAIYVDGGFANEGVSDLSFEADAALEFDLSTWGV